MRKIFENTIGTILISFGLAAQTATVFEVASVKPGTPENAARIRIGIQGGPGTSDPGQYTLENLPLKRLLSEAYGLKGYQISGPSWIDKDRFTVVAKVPAGATKEDVALMLQNLLNERFQLSVHREQRELPILAMVVGKGGPKFKEASAEESGGRSGGDRGGAGPGTGAAQAAARGGMAQAQVSAPGDGGAGGNQMHERMTLKKRTMASFADILTLRMQKPVIDMTGLTGKYDLTLEYAREAGPGIDVASSEIFSAIQEQLGLKLEARKSTLSVLIVDGALRVPVGN